MISGLLIINPKSRRDNALLKGRLMPSPHPWALLAHSSTNTSHDWDSRDQFKAVATHDRRRFRMATMAHVPWGASGNLYTIRRNLDHFVHSRQFHLTAANFHRFRLLVMVMTAFLSKCNQSEDESPPFQCSAGFVKSRCGFTSRRIYSEPRPAVTEGQRQD
jgi:hypothetical protein